MNPPIRTTLQLAAAAVFALASGACSDSSPGQAFPTGDGTDTSSTTSEPIGDGGLNGIDPCTLLSPVEVDQFGAQPGKRDDTSRTPACLWQVLGGNGSISVSLRNSQGLKDIVVNLGKLSDQRVGSHDGKILKENDGPGACMVVVGITGSSRVDVMGVYKTDTVVACDRAVKVAGLVEPRLPKGE